VKRLLVAAGIVIIAACSGPGAPKATPRKPATGATTTTWSVDSPAYHWTCFYLLDTATGTSGHVYGQRVASACLPFNPRVR
jgi:hypothetical protein